MAERLKFPFGLFGLLFFEQEYYPTRKGEGVKLLSMA